MELSLFVTSTQLLALRDEQQRPIWLPVKFKPFQNVYISRHKATGQDVFVGDETGGYFAATTSGSFRTYINGNAKSISMTVMRTIHFDYPQWCSFIDYSFDDPTSGLREHLKSIKVRGKPQWADVRGHPGYVIKRDGTMVAGGLKVVRKPQERKDQYFSIGFKACGVGKKKLIHRLVWQSFRNKDVPQGKTIDHRNGKRGDNRLENLRPLDPSGQNLNQKERREDSSWDMAIEVWTPQTNIWTKYSHKREALKHLDNVTDRKLWHLLSGRTRKTWEGIMARYVPIEPKNDLTGQIEQWFQLPGTKFYVSNAPDVPNYDHHEKSKGARFSTMPSGGVRVRVHFTPRPCGYIELGCADGGPRRLHRSVLHSIFGEEIPESFDVDHADGDNTNNFWMNLHVLTRAEHMAKTHGTAVSMDGIIYQTIAEAAKANDMSRSALHRKLKRNADPNLFVVPPKRVRTV